MIPNFRFTPAAKWAVIILTIIAVALIIAGFLVPPLGVIDGSVLKAVGELFGFAALWVVAHALFENQTDIHITHGDTKVDINTDEDEAKS